MSKTPESIDELLAKAMPLAGMTLGELSQHLNIPCPKDMRYAKGWLGQALERFLGATAGNLALPDFASIGVELKTLPLNAYGHPQESTHVTYAPIPFEEFHWHASTAFMKLKTILLSPPLALF